MGTRVVCRVRPPSCRAAVPSPVSSRAESSEILVASPAYSPSVSPGGAGPGGSPPPSSSPTQTHAFVFDGVFDGGATDDDVSRACLDPALHDVCVRGVNATVMAYGQSGAGKTHTMEGARGVDGKGLIPRAVAHVAGFRADMASRHERCVVTMVAVELYREAFRDLLNSNEHENSNTAVHVGACPARGVWPRGATELPVDTDDDGASALRSLRAASGRRAVGRTGLNADSSRSHFIVGLCVETDAFVSKLFLVDLAGCEKVARSGASGDRLDEAKGINKSLSALGNVVAALVDGQATPDSSPIRPGLTANGDSKTPTASPSQQANSHVPYRDSKLTFLLQESLGGSARATLIVCLSPDSIDVNETLSSLRFGARARCVTARLCDSPIGVGVSPMSKQSANAEIARLRVQVAKLTKELKGIKGSVPHRHLGLDASISVIGRGTRTLDRLTATIGKRAAGSGNGSGTDKQGGGSRLIWAGVALSFIFQAIDVAAG